MNNTVIFKSSVGSRNYNLDIEGSDKDYKIFVYPTFKDLYKEKRVSVSRKIDEDDVNIVDIRNFTQLMSKSNVNFLEVLFAAEVDLRDSLFLEVFAKRELIARMNLPYLYRACTGMAAQRFKMSGKETENTKDFFDTCGYDIKSAYQSIRILDFLKRYKDTGFENFAASIRYNESDPVRNQIMDIRKGKTSRDEYIQLYELMNTEAMNLKELYIKKEIDADLMKYLEDFIEDRVRNELKKEIS